jgi:uncharacterized membrane protein
MHQFLHRYRKLLPLLAFTILLNVIRMCYSRNENFSFLIWNLFLAIVPLYFSYRIRRSAAQGGAGEYIWAGLWLLFFPNAAYIITDLLHLKERLPVPKWFDLILLFSAALCGLAAGLLSLRETELWLKTKWNRVTVQVILFSILLLNGFGIYLGRYLRWNSWDLFLHPFRLGRNISAHVLDPGSYLQCWAMTLLFGCWLYLFYNGFKQWSRL